MRAARPFLATPEAADDAATLDPFKLSRAAVALVKLLAKGEADVGNPTLENFRAIAKLVTSNPEAFAEA